MYHHHSVCTVLTLLHRLRALVTCLLSSTLWFGGRKEARSFVVRLYWIASPSFSLYCLFLPRISNGGGGRNRLSILFSFLFFFNSCDHATFGALNSIKFKSIKSNFIESFRTHNSNGVRKELEAQFTFLERTISDRFQKQLGKRNWPDYSVNLLV